MKNLSKKSILGLIAFLLTAGVLTFFACEKEILILQSNAAEFTGFEAMQVGDVHDLCSNRIVSYADSF
ncbi:MAG: hypothetical protein IPM82_29400 [Saprospiraceae bacterium]|nr:hypothetical protein [Saprospiraceae bacterium]